MLDKPRDEYYQNTASRINTVAGDETLVWEKIFLARTEYTEQHGHSNAQQHFNTYLRDTYGIELKFKEGMVSLDVDIIDEEKYTIFLLRF